MPSQELWREAANWLKELGVLPPSSDVFKAQARVYDLALALQDGVILCKLSNSIVPNAIDTMFDAPDKQFLKMQNINAFLESAEKFGVPEKHLFDADELYYASDFPKVIACLSALSKTKSAKTRGIRHFPSNAKSQNSATTESGEDMYQSLEDLVGQSISFQEAAGKSNAYNPDAAEDEKEEDIYGAIMKDVSRNEEVYSQMLYSGGVQRGGGPVEEEGIYAQTGDKRNQVLNEITQTEKNYVDVLNVIIDKFMRPLMAKKSINKTDAQIIFSNVTDLLTVHTKLHEDIQAAMRSKTGRHVSQPILNHVESMRCYGQFCCDIPSAMNKIRGMDKGSFAKALEKARGESGQRFHLKDLLNVPMQRVLKYPLLMKELINATPDDHADKSSLTQAKAAVDDLAVFINTTKQEHDCLTDMIASLEKYSGAPLTNFAPFVKDGDLMYKDAKATKGQWKKLSLSYAFLLQKAIVFTKPKKTKYLFQGPLVEMNKAWTVADVPFWTLPKEEQHSKYSFAWAIKNGADTVHVFAAKTLPGKKKWMSALNKCLDVLKDGPAPEIKKRSEGANKGKKSRPAAAPPKTPTGAQSYEEWVPRNGPPTPKDPEPAAPGPGVQQLDDDRWYAGKMPRQKAEKLLVDCPDSAFLVREAETRPGEYSLSVKYNNNVKHIKINRHGKLYELAPDAKSFECIQELVEHFQTHSLNRHFPGMETTLSIPFKDAVGANAATDRTRAQAGIGRARSRFAYVARSHDELTFERGVELTILSMEDPSLDPGWYKGRMPNGTVGIFPANYVAIL